MRPYSLRPDDLARARAQLCSGSRSFFAASLLLPRRVRAPATILYAFCREADDAIDLGEDPVAALERLRARLDATYEGAALPGDAAFAEIVDAFELPRALLDALIDGMAWDASGRRYETFEQLLDYAARVAGAVGVMMALLMGVRDAAALARASDLGVAMQLTNIARDVGEDARAGRLFLPMDWLDEAGVDVAGFLAAPVFTPALGVVIARLLGQADVLYARARAGIAVLPLACRPGISAARRIYAAIGGEVAAAGFDSVSVRARVGGRAKLALAGVALGDMFGGAVPAPALAANQFLVAAAAREVVVPVRGYAGVLLIFERLERAQREAAAA
jgi:phytoene synthase